MRDRTEFHVNPDPLRPGALVRTRRMSPSGIHRAVVGRVERRNGETWVSGSGWRFAASELEVIRPPLPPRP